MAAFALPVQVGNLGRVVVVIGTDLQLVAWPPVVARLLWALGLGVALAALLAVWLSRFLGRRLEGLSGASRRLAGGDLSARAPVEGGDEISEVAVAFNEMAGDLEEARRREREFLVSVGHDLRTPLTTIAGYAEALHEGKVDSGRPGPGGGGDEPGDRAAQPPPRGPDDPVPPGGRGVRPAARSGGPGRASARVGGGLPGPGGGRRGEAGSGPGGSASGPGGPGPHRPGGGEPGGERPALHAGRGQRAPVPAAGRGAGADRRGGHRPGHRRRPTCRTSSSASMWRSATGRRGPKARAWAWPSCGNWPRPWAAGWRWPASRTRGRRSRPWCRCGRRRGSAAGGRLPCPP